MPIDEATLRAAVEQHADDIRLEYEEANIHLNSDVFVNARNSFRAGAAFAAELLASPAWVTAAEVDREGLWWYSHDEKSPLMQIQVVCINRKFYSRNTGNAITGLDGLWTPAIVPTPPTQRDIIAARTVERLAAFTEKLKSGEPIEVTRVSVEHTPDGPLTTREKGVL